MYFKENVWMENSLKFVTLNFGPQKLTLLNRQDTAWIDSYVISPGHLHFGGIFVKSMVVHEC